MVIERFNSDTPDQGWRPQHDRTAGFSMPERPADAGRNNLPEGKRARKRRKRSSEDGAITPAAAETTDNSGSNTIERKREADKVQVPPLLGEGVIWQSESALKPEHSDKQSTQNETLEAVATPAHEKPLTPQEAFILQQKLQAEAAAPSLPLAEEAAAAYQEQPKQQHLSRDEGLSGQDDSQSTNAEHVSQSEVEAGTGPEVVDQHPEQGSHEHSDAAIEEEPEIAERQHPDQAEAPHDVLPASPETPPDMPPPVLPPDPSLFERQPSQWSYEAPAAVPSAGALYESVTPPGMQRTTADVSRAAWTGAIAGWWAGRRGKRKAVEQAHNDGVAEGLALAGQRLEAEPLHTYTPQEADRATIIPLSVETKPVTKPSGEAVVAEGAAVAALERLRPSLRPAVEVPPTARAAAKRVTEQLAGGNRPRGREMPAAVPGSRSERDMPKRELLKAAKNIKIEGISLKDVFDAKRIDEEGLRAVVGAYLRGGSVSEQLSKEIAAKEMSFERDPLFRHNRRTSEALERAGERVGRVFNRGIDAARDLAGERGSQLAASTQRTAHKAGQVVVSGAKQAQHDLVDNGNTADWFGITAIVVVWSIILLLIVT